MPLYSVHKKELKRVNLVCINVYTIIIHSSATADQNAEENAMTMIAQISESTISDAVDHRLQIYAERASGAFSSNTERAIRSDTALFVSWCRKRGLECLPPSLRNLFRRVIQPPSSNCFKTFVRPCREYPVSAAMRRCEGQHSCSLLAKFASDSRTSFAPFDGIGC